MRYKLDINGYIDCVLWGCYSGSCQEYTGTVPSGYETLTEWADNAIINAYYIDDSGNLALDAEREADLKIKIEQQTKDYTPVLRRELYETAEVLDSQYVKETTFGKFIMIDNVKNIPPVVTLSDLQKAENITIFAHTRNMLPIGKNGISGSATIGDNTELLFALLAGEEYYLNVGNYICEMFYYNGETTEQIYSGGSGVITLPENKKVTKIVLSGNGVVYPTLNPGSEAIAFEEGKTKFLTIPLGAAMEVLTISSDMGNVNLHNGYNLVYTDQGNYIFMEYSTTGLTGSVGGWKIEGNALYCDIVPPGDYTAADIDKIKSYIMGDVSLTDEEFDKYDVNKDGKIQATDYRYIQNLIDAGISKSEPGKLLLNTEDYLEPIKLCNGKGKVIASFGVDGVNSVLDPKQKVLWEGCYDMTASHECKLSEPISKQANGIILCWSRYTDGAASNTYWNYNFVPRSMVEAMPGTGTSFFLTATPRAGHMVSAKYLYIYDELIKGYNNNGSDFSKTDSGLTLTNKEFVLRYVIGF